MPAHQTSSFLVKICGLSTPETMAIALEAKADLVGLVFHPKSPRHVAIEHAIVLANQARGKAEIVALVVDITPQDARSLVEALKPDWLQLHGRETPEHVAAIRAETGVRIIKAVGISEAADLVTLAHFQPVCDALLVDAKPPADAAYPGGHGRTFDWNILKALDPALPFMLSGGLSPENVAEAITRISAMGVKLTGVDVSSGVESAPGVKDTGKIKSFIEAARNSGAKLPANEART